MARSRDTALMARITAGEVRNVGFAEFCRLIEAFGFELRRINGSHHIYPASASHTAAELAAA